MPAISIDTFFACSLMVILVLSAMAGTSKILYPHINSMVDQNVAERYREISKYLLLNDGTPPDWGKNSQVIPETFGLAKANSENPYNLDTDKVTRLNSENLYALSYAQIFTTLKMSDLSFRIGINPIFDVSLKLAATFSGTNETSYQFEILTEENGSPVQAQLKGYIIAKNYLDATSVHTSDGRISLNITISDSVVGPARFVVFAKAAGDAKIVSFNAYAFAHKSAEPNPDDAFLRLSPLDYVLNASFVYPKTVLSDVYALSFNYNSTLTLKTIENQSVTFEIPHFVDSCPTLIVVTGQNSTAFFTEWTTYPQIPLQLGADFANTTSLSNVFAYTCVVTIDSVLYECTIWVGGAKE